MYLIIEPCFENLIHYYPSALEFYKTNFGKFWERPVKEAGIGFMKAKFGFRQRYAGGADGEKTELVAGNRMRFWLPWEWERNYLLEKKHAKRQSTRPDDWLSTRERNAQSMRNNIKTQNMCSWDKGGAKIQSTDRGWKQPLISPSNSQPR